jgi:hypothetical protein
MRRPKIVYHFTNRAWWHFIEKEGITRGECPVNRRLVLNWPNFTTDPEPANQGWSGGRLTGKTAVRIGVRVRPKDSNWIPWVDLTKQHGMDSKTFAIYHNSGGRGSKNWWVYRGVVRPDTFESVDFLDGGRVNPMIARILRVASSLGAESYRDFVLKGGREDLRIAYGEGYAMTPIGRAYPVPPVW